MKRRGFLGFLGGAAVAGPSMVKQAAAQTMADLRLPGIATSGIGCMVSGDTVGPGIGLDVAYQAERFAKFNLLKLDPTWRTRKLKERWIEGLDPDLASYRSFSLGAKIRAQRSRNFDTWLDEQDSWFDRALSGSFERDDF